MPKYYKVIALSCGAKNRILNSGEFVTEDAFEDEQEVIEKVKEGFLKGVPESEVEGVKREVKQEPAKAKSSGGLLGKLVNSQK